MKTVLDQVTMRNLAIELVPSPNWRERAAKGEVAMFYSVSGEVAAGDEVTRVTFSLDAVKDNALVGCGLEKPAADGSVYRLLANRGTGHEALISAVTDAQGRLVPVLKDGRAVYLEPEIPQADGQPFPMEFVSKYLVNVDRSRTFKLKGVTLRKEAVTQQGMPCCHASVDSVEIVDAPRAQALGGRVSLTGVTALPTAQAARRDAAAKAADIAI